MTEGTGPSSDGAETHTGQEACLTLLQVLDHGLGRGGGLSAGQPIQPLLDFFGAGLAEDAGHDAALGGEEGGAVADVRTLFCTLSLPVGACTPKPMRMLPRLEWRGFQSQPCATRALSPSPAE